MNSRVDEQPMGKALDVCCRRPLSNQSHLSNGVTMPAACLGYHGVALGFCSVQELGIR